MKILVKPLIALVLAVGLLGAVPTVAGAAGDPSSSWSEPLGGPSFIDGTGEQAEQDAFDPVIPMLETFTSESVGDVVTISGAGNGHGVGMSQWGSQGRALDGQTYQQILAAYYKGTTRAQDTLDAPLWVNLEAELVKVYLKVEQNVSGGTSVTVKRDDTGAYGGNLRQAVVAPGGTVVVEYVDRSGPIVLPISNPRRCTFSTFAPGANPATATPAFESGVGSCVIDLNWDGWNGNPTTRVVIDKRWHDDTPASTGLDCVHTVGVSLDCAYARGTMHIRPDDYNESSDIGFNVVQELSLDDYARGIGEMPYSWDRDALKVQAVAGRSFARYLQQIYRDDPVDRQWCWCSLYDQGPDQTYLGWGFDEVSEFGSYADNWVAAANETAGELLLYNGRYISANYSASNGGATENNEDIWGGSPLSYLRSIPDPLDLTPKNPLRSWTRSVPVDYFAAKVGLDAVTSARIVSTYDSGSPSDIAVTGTKNGAATTRHYTATQFMKLFSGTAYRLYAPHILSVNVPGDTPPPRSVDFSLDRWWGQDRYETAVEVSKASHPSGTNAVFVATGENYPDALAATSMAHDLGGPVLLTRTRSVPAATVAEIKRLGPSRIYILGGTAAVSASVESELAKLGPVTRVWGRDRYATAAEISKVTFSSGANIAYVAVGTNYPDALVGAPIVAGREGPLLLTRGDTLNSFARDELKRLGPNEIVVVGGGGIISNSVVAQLRDLAPKVTSVIGSNRYSTAIEVSRHAFPSGAHTVFVAIGTRYPDALAGGPPAADVPGPILLVPETYLPSSVAEELLRLDPNRVVILGGPAAVSSAVESAIAALFK